MRLDVLTAVTVKVAATPYSLVRTNVLEEPMFEIEAYCARYEFVAALSMEIGQAVA
jgi:hypothetical protein